MNRAKAYGKKLNIPTYGIGKTEKNPMFFEKRVYQGSSGKVYPNTVIEKIYDEKKNKEYDAVILENDYLYVIVLPELGGRIYTAFDKTNGYDFVYCNKVIKPALVGLLGPWISGGIEFNWPQHHRPTTFLPVNYSIKNFDDGSACVYVGESEVMFGLKHTTQIKLFPDKAYIEISTDVYNRGELPQTFLWWANPAYKVNDNTATIMPIDVTAVMDHGKRAVSTFPISTGEYYKMDYSKGVDISRYKNVPVPTSFMAYKSDFDFVGGYDYGKQAGLLHIADHHISPGKKQWTWGCGDFGIAWDRNLTDNDGPYVELMTGCFTDNQPDFTFIEPHETKSFTQYFMPYHAVGRILNADENICFGVEDGVLTVYSGICTDTKITVVKDGRMIFNSNEKFAPCESKKFCVCDASCVIKIKYADRQLTFEPSKVKKFAVPSPATQCPPPEECLTNEELYLCGTHIEQYRHATRSAEDYYLEGLKRDDSDARINNAYGAMLLRRGNFQESLVYLNKSIDKYCMKNGNPRETEQFFNAGLAYFYLNKYDDAYDSFYKCLWGNDKAQAYYYLSVIAKIKGDLHVAIKHASEAVLLAGRDTRALNTLGRLYRDIGEDEKAEECFKRAVSLDELDIISAFELGNYSVLKEASAGEIRIVCADYLFERRYDRMKDLLTAWNSVSGRSDCITQLYLAYAESMSGKDCSQTVKCAVEAFERNTSFAVNLADIAVLTYLNQEVDCYLIPYQLGNLYYDKKNYTLAEKYWIESIEKNKSFATAKRNLALYYFNKKRDKNAALKFMQEAFLLDKTDSRVLLELFELLTLIGVNNIERLDMLKENIQVVEERDDLYLYYLELLFEEGNVRQAAELLSQRKFHPWEGGEGKVTKLYKKVCCELAKQADKQGNYEKAESYYKKCFTFPENLGEGKLILDYDNDVCYFLGELAEKYGKTDEAKHYYQMAVRGRIEVLDNMYYNDNPIDYVYYAALAYKKLNDAKSCDKIKKDLLRYADIHIDKKAVIDYFAVSLPDMLIWEQDIDERNREFCKKLRAMAEKL